MPCSSGYARQLMFERLWVQIRIWDGHFYTLICCKDCLKRQKINGKEAGVGPFKKSLAFFIIDSFSFKK